MIQIKYDSVRNKDTVSIQCGGILKNIARMDEDSATETET